MRFQSNEGKLLISPEPGYSYWQWYHVYEDEINHRGEMSWRLSRMNHAI